MTAVVVSDAAHNDLLLILGDLASAAGAKVASLFASDIQRFYERLELFPKSGSPRRALGADARIGIVYPYVIVYDFSEDEDKVTILCVVHGRRDITSRLARGG